MSVAAEIIKALGQRPMGRKELLAAMPDARVSTVDSTLTALVNRGAVVRIRKEGGGGFNNSGTSTYSLPAPATNGHDVAADTHADGAESGQADDATAEPDQPPLFALWSDGTFTAVSGEQRIDLDQSGVSALVAYLLRLSNGTDLTEIAK